MAFALFHALLLFFAAAACIFLRYKDGSGYGSLAGGFLLFMLSAFLYPGVLTYDSGATATAYQNLTSYTVAHTCTDPRNESWFEYETDGSDCGGNPVVETVTFSTVPLPVSSTPLTESVQPDVVRALSVVSMATALLFLFDGVVLYTRKKKQG
jgi:hypothetical protein